MQTKIHRTAGFGLVACAIALACGPAQAARKSAGPELSTPAGITLVNVTKIYVSSQDQYLWRRLGDADGKPLYTFNDDPMNGKPACVDECAKEFPPLLAAKNAKAFSDWTLVSREKGARQWAYQGKPLYRFSGTDPAGTPFAGDTASAVAEDPAWTDPASKFYSPKEGWKRAAYAPDKTLQSPPGLELRSLPVADGFGLVDVASGMTIYAAPAKRKMSRMWLPVQAPALASPVGDFTLTDAEDGTRQWVYKGNRLFTFRGDYSPGDVEGIFAEPDMRAALVYRNFLPESLTITMLPGRGPIMMTREGLSVYTQARYNLQYGGRQTRTGYSIPYHEAKAVGTRGCVDSCTKLWRPLQAPQNAQAGGFWEVATRADGSKQWAYKGSPLYTYANDKKAGDIEGNNRHVPVYGDPEGTISLAVTVGDRKGGGASYQAGSGFYWHIAGLYY